MDPSTWRVLVVEDEFDSVQMVSKILQHHGARVYVARDGRECMALINEINPTFVMMDLALPEMDGWETLQHIRKAPETADLPVVAITAYHSVSVEEDAAAAGFNAYFPKPLDISTIVDQLGAVIDAAERRRN